MARFSDFARQIKQVNFHPSGVEGQIVADELADFARSEVRKAIDSGAASPVYDLYVNGHPATSEDVVQVPGPILYVFSYWTEIIEAALVELVKRSPRNSGRYANSFVVLVNGRVVAPGADISSAAEVIITNVQPYARKVQVGAMQMSVAPRMFDKARRSLVRKFGSARKGYHFQVKFLDLPRGIHPLVPYVLRTGGRRKDRRAGERITYPALVMNLAN